MFLTKTSSTPVLVALTCTLLLAKISSGQMHEEYEILDCSGTFLEKNEAHVVLTTSTERKDGECTFFIKVQANRSIRMKFKCIDINSTRSNSDCFQQISVSALNNNTWTSVQSTFSLNRDKKSFCITSENFMISLNTKVPPYMNHWKARYEVTDNECEKDVKMKEPEAETQWKIDEANMSKEAVYYQGLVNDQVMATSLSTKSTKTLNFKAIPLEEHVKPKESSTNIKLLFPTPSHRSMHYHVTQSTVPLNSLPITADFQNESSVGHRESSFGSLNRGEQYVSSNGTGASKEAKISNLYLSLQEYLAKSQSTPTRKFTSRFMKSPFSKKGERSTTIAKKSRTASLHPTEINYSASIAEMGNAGKDIDAIYVGTREEAARKQHNMSANEHLKETAWSEARGQRSEISFETHSTKLRNLDPPPQFFHVLQAMGSKSLKSEIVPGASIKSLSSHGYSVISGDINEEDNNRYLPYTKHLRSNLSTSGLPQVVGDSRISDHLSLTKSNTKSQPVRTVMNPTVSSISGILQWSLEVTEHRIAQSSHESLNQYTTSFKPSNATRRSKAKSSSITPKNRDHVRKHRQLHPTQNGSLSSLRTSGKRTGIAPSSFNIVYGTSSSVHGQFKTGSFTSWSSKQTPTLSSFVKENPDDHFVNSTQSMTDENAERTVFSFSVNSSYFDPAEYSSENEESLEGLSTKYVSVNPSDSLKDAEVSHVSETTAPLYNHFVSTQLKKKVTTQVAISSISKGNKHIPFTTKMNPQATEDKISGASKSAEGIQINVIRPSTISLRSSELLRISTHMKTGNDISLTYGRKESSQIYFTPSFGYLQYSETLSMVTETQTSSTFLRPTKSSGLSLKSSSKLKSLEDSCSYHFISNINGLETGDEMKFEVQDILSLKIKRIIAVSWPYYGYLGRAGFIHRGLVLQTMDGRLWYNHIQNKESHVYMVYINALQDLHGAVRITYSHNVSEGEDTLKDHVDVWGEQVGMYFRTCSKKEQKNRFD